MEISVLQDAFDVAASKQATGRIIFTPEVKIKRESDTLYIGELKKTKTGTLVAVVEVYNGISGDKAPMPVDKIGSLAQKVLLERLKR